MCNVIKFNEILNLIGKCVREINRVFLVFVSSVILQLYRLAKHGQPWLGSCIYTVFMKINRSESLYRLPKLSQPWLYASILSSWKSSHENQKIIKKKNLNKKSENYQEKKSKQKIRKVNENFENQKRVINYIILMVRLLRDFLVRDSWM